METYITICKTESQWESALDAGKGAGRDTVHRGPESGARRKQLGTEAEGAKPASMPAPRGCKGEGPCVCLRLTRGDVWQKPTRCCKVTKIKKHGAQCSFWGPPASTGWGWGHARKRLRWGISRKPQEATFPGKTFQHENPKIHFKVEFQTSTSEIPRRCNFHVTKT